MPAVRRRFGPAVQTPPGSCGKPALARNNGARRGARRIGRLGGVTDSIEGGQFRGEDWYGEDLGDRRYIGCEFVDIDLTEATSAGATFTDCVLTHVKLNASRHTASAFVGCTFTRCNLFEARLVGCKLMGSAFRDCDLRPLTVDGGDWSFVTLTGADLRGVSFQRVRMREADLSRADCEGGTLTDVDLSGGILKGVRFTRCDLRGSDLTALDPRDAALDGAVITPQQAVVVAQTLGFELR